MLSGDGLISEQELADMERRVASATSGPWVAHLSTREHLSGDDFIMLDAESQNPRGLYLICDDNGGSDGDYDFIASARQDVPRLIAQVRRLQAASVRREGRETTGDINER